MDVRRTGLRVFLACAAGAFIGTLVSLSHAWFWPLGLALGGIVGYLTYDLKQVVSVTKRVASQQFDQEIVKQRLRSFGYFIGAIAVNLLWVAFFSIGEFFSGDHYYKGYAMGIVCIVYANLVGWAFISENKKIKRLAEENWAKAYWTAVWKYFNPIALAVWIVIGLAFTVWIFLQGIFCLIVGCICLIPILGKITKKVFIEIHSDIRLLCGIDAAIGALFGYAAGSCIVGALVGGLWGIANYWVVSIKLLKLPERA